jgi:hypothetical protein
MIMFRIVCCVAFLVPLAPGGACAGILSLSFADPIGDHTGRKDVTGMTLNFDSGTGDYHVLLTADAANPFSGTFRININLLNPDTGTTAPNPSYFQDTFRDFNLSSPLTTIRLTGTDARLMSWQIGDRVATTSTPFGNPPGVSLFRSAVGDFPLGPPGIREDIIAQGDTFATVTAVPEPGSAVSLGIGLACCRAIWWRRRRAEAGAVPTGLPG